MTVYTIEGQGEVIVFANSQSDAEKLVSQSLTLPVESMTEIEKYDKEQVIKDLFPDDFEKVWLSSEPPENGVNEFSYTPEDLKNNHFILTACDIVIRGHFNPADDFDPFWEDGRGSYYDWWDEVDYDGPRMWKVKLDTSNA
jgi:hypothetical protein